ncbi:hypothetical protein [Aquimarina sediminis]|uniref:hypothetical protein n=1 Tax=Aquimarina sediminis TaxID=2070536 RepID=UPI000CA013C9|nr:hypothetical protein [Aquimarina sediminis]
MTNELIRKNLTKRKESCLFTLNSISNLDRCLKDVLRNLNKFDFSSYKHNLEKEILKNLKEWWTNPNKGIKKEEQLFAILFEYDYFFQKNVEATAYGIGEWKDYRVQTDKFNMGFDYDFTTEFYACPGIRLNFFDSLESLDYSNLPKKHTNNNLNFEELKIEKPIEIDEFNGIEDLLGYHEIVELHKFQGMLAVHDVLLKLDSKKVFESVNYKNNFMFLIDEHDSGEVYPLLIKNK